MKIPKDYKRSVIEFYNDQYNKIDNYILLNWRKSYHKRIFQALQISNKRKENKDEVFLDIGAGGESCEVIESALRGIKSYGIDISDIGIEKSKQLARKILQKKDLLLANFIVSSAEKLPFPKSCFSKVCSISTLEYVEDDEAAIKEIARVTKPGGRIFICVSNQRPAIFRLNEYIVDRHKAKKLRFYDPQELIRKFSGSGFSLIDLTYHGHFPKMIQFFLQQICPSVQKIDSKLWWALENWDLRMKSNKLSFMFSITLEKK